jgi:hypothetical protein
MTTANVMSRMATLGSNSFSLSDVLQERGVHSMFVSYIPMVRYFCSRHSPPVHMIHSGMLLDDEQAMELAVYKESCKKKRKF